jgi:diguanylate cyclase (GGDEF)-like protein/PAS domain S-box-containing protein
VAVLPENVTGAGAGAASASPDPLGADVDAFDLAAIGMVITDMTGHFRRVNPAFGRLLGRDPAALVGTPFVALTSPDDVAPSTGAMQDLVARRTETATFDKRYLHADGSSVWVEMNIRSLIGPDGRVAGFLTQAVDITARKRAQAAVEEERRRLDEAQHVAGLGSFKHDAATGRIEASAELASLFALSDRADMQIAELMDRIHPDDRAMVTEAMRSCFRDRQPVDFPHRLVRPDGTVRWIHARAMWTTEADGRSGVVGTVLDITERRLAEEALEFQTYHDSLTGLANRALFLDRLDHALRRTERHGDPIAVLFLDLDDFKTVNDSLGHQAGDLLLTAVAGRLGGVTRAGDTLGRLGGDEFGLLVESGPMPQTAEDVAHRIEEAMKAPFQLQDRLVSVRVSIGIAIGHGPDDASGDVMRDADLAMYAAKQGGKGHFELFRHGMQDEALERLSMIADLRTAVDDDEFEVFYQPIVSAQTNIATGCEALVRWHHPRRGLLQPNTFIGLAEANGVIGPLGAWVLAAACGQAQTWRRDGIVGDGFYMSVNLSARQLAEPGLVDTVGRALETSGLPPEALVLEITESALMADFDAALDQLNALKRLGVRIALDDYGTGYSSLNRLGKLPVDIVKIDKTFIDQLTVSREGRALVQSVLDVTRALGMSSTAEGIEQHAQRAALEEMECDSLQGYLFAKPKPADDAARILARLAEGQPVLPTPSPVRPRTRGRRRAIRAA